MKKESKYIEDEQEYNRHKEQREITFNGMSATEWALSSRSVWKDIPNIKVIDEIDENEVLPDELLDRLISIYSKEGDVILDPFMGSGTSIISGIRNNRFCYGFEINKKIYEYANNNIIGSLNLLVNGDYDIRNANAIDEIKKLKDKSVQLTITSPSLPYLKKKGEANDNFASMKLDEYLIKMEEVMKEIYRVSKKNAYCVFVVSDYRNIKNNEPYVEFHHEIAEIGKKVGFLYQDLVIYDHNDQRGLLLLGYPKIFYANMNHSYIVVLRKA